MKSAEPEQKKLTDREVELLWDEFTDVPFDEYEQGELILAVDWQQFKAGTERMEIWHWFDEHYSKGIVGLLGRTFD